jgi:hypothetical protein
MLAQLTVSAQVNQCSPALVALLTHVQVEREMGSGGFFITYFAAGIFG